MSLYIKLLSAAPSSGENRLCEIQKTKDSLADLNRAAEGGRGCSRLRGCPRLPGRNKIGAQRGVMGSH